MNRRVWVCVGLIFGVSIVTNRAWGQALRSTGGPGLATNIKNATNAESYVKDIRQFIQDQIGRLQSPDIADQAQARQKLIAECPGGASVSPSYYAVYVREWSNAGKAVIAPGNPLRLRLNIAIITASLASNATLENSRSLEIEPVVDMALADREGSIVLWGIRAAKSLIPVIIQEPDVRVPGKAVPVSAVAASKLIASLVKAVKSHADSDIAGFLVLDSYHALVVREVPGIPDDAVKKLLPPLIDPVLDLLEFRVAQYAKKAVPLPGNEREATTFLSTSYLSATPADQKRIREDLVILITYAGERCSLYTVREDVSQVRDMLKYASQALVVIAGDVNYPGAASGLSWLTSIPPSSTSAEIEAHTKQVWATMALAFKDMPKPAAIPAIGPPPATPTAPVTSGASTPPAPQ